MNTVTLGTAPTLARRGMQPSKKKPSPPSEAAPRVTLAEAVQLLLQETPIVYPYWINGLTATASSVGGVNPTSIAQIFLGQAFKSA